MASVAGNHAFAFKALGIDREHHLHHVARFIFFFFVVLVEMHGDVAMIAPHTERLRDEYHRGNQFVRRNVFQNLNAFLKTSPAVLPSRSTVDAPAPPAAARGLQVHQVQPPGTTAQTGPACPSAWAFQ